MKKVTLVFLAVIFIFNINIFGQKKLSPIEQQKIEQKYPSRMGNLLFDKNYVVFQNIKSFEIKTETLKVYNDWYKPINFYFKNIPNYISCKAVPSTLKGGEAGVILVSFDAPKRNDFGYVFYRLGIQTTDSLQPMKLFNISANITEDFSKLTPKQIANAPVIVFKTEKYSFPEVTTGTNVTYNFEFSNQGKTDLIIRKAKASCGCTAIQPEKKTLKPGESSKIKVVFNTRGRKGAQHKTVTIISNDPKNFQKILHIQGTVK